MKNKQGFTLAEMMIVLLIISIIAAATVPLITRRHRKYEDISHGVYACYYNKNSVLVETYKKTGGNIPLPNDGVETPVTNQSGKCTFVPPNGSKTFNMYLIGGGGGGGYVNNEGNNWISQGNYSKNYYLPYKVGSTWYNESPDGNTFNIVDTDPNSSKVGRFQNAVANYLTTSAPGPEAGTLAIDTNYVDYNRNYARDENVDADFWVKGFDGPVAQAAIDGVTLTLGASGGGGGAGNEGASGGNGGRPGFCKYTLSDIYEPNYWEAYTNFGYTLSLTKQASISVYTDVGKGRAYNSAGYGGGGGDPQILDDNQSPFDRIASYVNNLSYRGKLTGAASNIFMRSIKSNIFMRSIKIADNPFYGTITTQGGGSSGDGTCFSLQGTSYCASPAPGGGGASYRVNNGQNYAVTGTSSTINASCGTLGTLTLGGDGGDGGYMLTTQGSANGRDSSPVIAAQFSRLYTTFTPTLLKQTPLYGKAGSKGSVKVVSDMEIPTSLVIDQVGTGGKGGISTDQQNAADPTGGGETKVGNYTASGGTAGISNSVYSYLWHAYTALQSVVDNKAPDWLYGALCYKDSSMSIKTNRAYCSYGENGALPDYPDTYPKDFFGPVAPSHGFCFDLGSSASTCSGGSEAAKIALVNQALHASFGASGAGGSAASCAPYLFLSYTTSTGKSYNNSNNQILYPAANKCSYYNQGSWRFSDYASGGDGTSGAVVITW